MSMEAERREEGHGWYGGDLPRAGDRILAPWEEDREALMSTEEWLALSEERRREIVLMYEKLREKRRFS